MSGPVALVGSGEYLPVMDPIERALFERARALGRPARFVQLATAAAPEGPASLARWHALGAAAAARIDAEQVVVPVVDRETADAPELAALVDGAGLIYLSGGNPAFLTETLRGTAVWQAIEQAWHDGAALAGCSAGAMALGGRVPHIRDAAAPPIPGLGVVPGIEVLPHFDVLDRRFPGLVAGRMAEHPGHDAVRLIGIDEETALVTGVNALPAGTWQVMGRSSVWLLDPRTARRQLPPDATLTLP
ncbi:MAG: Type 1 glutamine amidotransferase-like domain-containing protein [Kineosporiaceae bacterium]